MKKGFTLIELLVVVLIIGILSAIAVPQYNKTVAKARAAEGLSKINTLYQALEVYKLANDDYPSFGTQNPTQDQMNQALDIDMNLGTGYGYTYYPWAYVAITYSKSPVVFYITKGLSDTPSEIMYQKGTAGCFAYPSYPGGINACKSLCGELTVFSPGGAEGCLMK